jgi:phage gp36-like protein
VNAYAEVQDVLARAGDVARAWSDATRPSLADIDRYLDDAAFQIDAFLAGRGVEVPATGPAAEALREPTALIALRRALAASPGAGHPDLRATVDADVRAFWDSMLDGSAPVLVALSSARDADSLWQAQARAPRAQYRAELDPPIKKGMYL